MRFLHTVPVRFRDLDALGHVHHTAPLLYLEEARAAYWRAVAGRGGVGSIDYVMGDVAVRYHRRIPYPATVAVGVRVAELGSKGFLMEFEIRDEAGGLLVSGSTTQVMFDYEAGTSKPIDDALRARIEAWEAAGVPLT